MASAYVGSTFMPPLFGVLGNVISFGIMPFYLFVFIILMICMIEFTFKITSKKEIGSSVFLPMMAAQTAESCRNYCEIASNAVDCIYIIEAEIR